MIFPVPAERLATIIPSVTVPLALVGTLGAMYLFGFSLDNLSLSPAVASFASQIGAGTAGQQGNDDRVYINLKPCDQRPNEVVVAQTADADADAHGSFDDRDDPNHPANRDREEKRYLDAGVAINVERSERALIYATYGPLIATDKSSPPGFAAPLG